MLKDKIPKLTKSTKKGDSGIILVIGGSEMYTGAPFFVSLSALRTGSDLVYIMCEPQALTSLKVLSPESVVTTIQYEEWILRRVTACAFGSGLGRPNHSTMQIIDKIIQFLKRRDIPLIVDGDGIHLYTTHTYIFKEYTKIIFTPNCNEKIKLVNFNIQYSLEKGRYDLIRVNKILKKVKKSNSLKRCGGQGDILVGILSVLFSWIQDGWEEKEVVEALCCGSKIVRHASYCAYKKKGRSLIAKDIIEYLPSSVLKYIG